MLSFINESFADWKREMAYRPGPFDGEMSPKMRKLATVGLAGGAIGMGYLLNKYYRNELPASIENNSKTEISSTAPKEDGIIPSQPASSELTYA